MLQDLVVSYRTVKYNDNEIKVRGLSLNDLAFIIQDHGKDFGDLFDGNLSIAELIPKCPGMVAKIIACAADDPDNWEKVNAYPAGLQIKLVEVIWNQSMLSKETVGNFISSLMQGVESLGSEIGSPQSAGMLKPSAETATG